MSKYGYNEKELRKTIITKIDKDGFHNRTVVYGKDSGESQSSDLSTAIIMFKNNTSTPFEFRCPMITDGVPNMADGLYIDNAGTFKNGNSAPIVTILYKGGLMVPFWVMIRSNTFAGDFFSSFKLDLSGNVELAEPDDDDDYFHITGNCNITIKDYDESPN